MGLTDMAKVETWGPIGAPNVIQSGAESAEWFKAKVGGEFGDEEGEEGVEEEEKYQNPLKECIG